MKPILLILLTTAAAWAAGPLTPPGPPAPTMKTLDQVEARTPIESLPFTISSPGSYYFTGNLLFSDTSGNAITITTDNVTLDLNGFTLSSTPGVTGIAISVNDDLNNIAIKNGSIVGNTTVTVSGTKPDRNWDSSQGGFQDGIDAEASQPRNCSVVSLQVRGCRRNGIFMPYGSVADSTVCYNGATGIVVEHSRVTNCTSSYNDGRGISANDAIVTNSKTTFNRSHGVYAPGGTVRGCTADDNGFIGILANYGSVAGCVASSNDNDGFAVSDGSVTSSTARSNGLSGFTAQSSSVTGCVADGNNTSSTANEFDLKAPNAVVAFTRYGTGDTTGSTLTGNLTP